jgi:hypothetical protein
MKCRCGELNKKITNPFFQRSNKSKGKEEEELKKYIYLKIEESHHMTDPNADSIQSNLIRSGLKI